VPGSRDCCFKTQKRGPSAQSLRTRSRSAGRDCSRFDGTGALRPSPDVQPAVGTAPRTLAGADQSSSGLLAASPTTSAATAWLAFDRSAPCGCWPVDRVVRSRKLIERAITARDDAEGFGVTLVTCPTCAWALCRSAARGRDARAAAQPAQPAQPASGSAGQRGEAWARVGQVGVAAREDVPVVGHRVAVERLVVPGDVGARVAVVRDEGAPRARGAAVGV
jgi:hypothetical protein